MQHPVAAAFLYVAVIAALAVPAAIRRFRQRTQG